MATHVRTAVVTGGSSGIGAAIVQSLLEADFRVVNVDIREAATAQPTVHFRQVDLSDRRAAADAARDIAQRFDVDHLVNNAGVALPASLEQSNDDTFDTSVDLHQYAAVAMARAFVPTMKRLRYGRIVNMSSRAMLGKRDRTDYAGSKAALVGYTRVWALELGPFGITVNALAPGPIVTELFERGNGPEAAARLVASTAVGRGGTPQDVAHAAMFLLSERSGFVTGQVLHVCGGASLGTAPW